MGLNDQYRYPWKPPYAQGWLLGWPWVGPLDEEDVEDQYGYFDVWRGGGNIAERNHDDNDNVIHLYTYNQTK